MAFSWILINNGYAFTFENLKRELEIFKGFSLFIYQNYLKVYLLIYSAKGFNCLLDYKMKYSSKGLIVVCLNDSNKTVLKLYLFFCNRPSQNL